jgi:branched-chain amino acid transport system substrate-binding protein
VASKLVLTDKVDILVGAWTPATINPVSAVAERYKIPALMENGPIESWLTGGPYHWAFCDCFYMHRMVDSYIDAFDTVKTNKKVGFIFDNQVDGILLSKMVGDKASARGYTIVDPGRFPMGTKDYTTIISQFKQAGVDIVIANEITPDFALTWRQFHQQGFIPKIFVIGKGLHFRDAAEALGDDLGNGLLSEDMWDPHFNYKSSLTGQTAAQLSAGWEKTGKFADLTIGYDMSTFEVLADVLRRAKSVDREKVRVAFTQTNLNTIFGLIKYNDQNLVDTPVVVAQWVRTKNGGWDKRVIANGGFPGIPLAKEKLFFLPGSK